jgi:hypothetical protein
MRRLRRVRRLRTRRTIVAPSQRISYSKGDFKFRVSSILR